MKLLPGWMRAALFATAVMNLLAGAVFVPAAEPVRRLVGLPEAGHPFYPATVAMFIVLFGVAYLWVAVSGRTERLFIALAAAGKFSFFALLVWFWAAGTLPARAPILGTADLVFSALFATWLFGAQKTRGMHSQHLDQWKESGRRFRHRGHEIFYRDEGRGPVLLCVHGFPTASWDWHRVWPQLVTHYRLISLDMIGFGFSAKPHDYDYAIADQASIHEELLASLGITTAHILAHDYGDTVAQELLARYEDRRRTGAVGLDIRSLVLLNGGLFPETHRARLIQKLLLTPLGPLLSRLSNQRAFGRSFAAIFGPDTKPSEEEMAEFWQLVSYNDGHRISHELIRYIEERRTNRERWVGALQKTTVPLRLINGPEDPVSGQHMAERYRDLVPNPDIVLLPGIGHYPQVEDPAGVVAALRAFAPLADATS